MGEGGLSGGWGLLARMSGGFAFLSGGCFQSTKLLFCKVRIYNNRTGEPGTVIGQH